MLQHLSIPRKLNLIMAFLALPLAGLWGISVFSMNMHSAMRAYVGGEGLWSKAQKEAVYHLVRYTQSHEEKDYDAFVDRLSVNEGDHEARLALDRPNPSWNLALEGFLRGGNHVDDVPGLIHLFVRFRHLSYMERAIGIWSDADIQIDQLRRIGRELHGEIQSGRAQRDLITARLLQLDAVDGDLTVLENAFSATLGDAARWLSRIVDRTMAVSAVLFLGAGLFLAIAVARQLVGPLSQLRTAAQRVSEGDYRFPLPVEGQDEIGELARAFHDMRLHRQHVEDDLRATNKELESFSYSVSHDLRAPLRAIDGFSQILLDEHSAQLSEQATHLLKTVRGNVARMSDLIDGLLSFSQLSRRPLQIRKVDVAELVRSVVEELLALEKGRTLQFKIDPLAIVVGDPTLLREVFSNLISNALKFSKHSETVSIEVGYRSELHRHVFFVKDNGVGFDMQYAGKLFGVFQRLHAVEEFEGNGIGLALVQRIVLRHGGAVWAESRPKEGATFYVALPAGPEESPPAK